MIIHFRNPWLQVTVKIVTEDDEMSSDVIVQVIQDSLSRSAATTACQALRYPLSQLIFSYLREMKKRSIVFRKRWTCEKRA